MLALAWAPATVSANSQLRRPTTKGRMAFSARLLSGGSFCYHYGEILVAIGMVVRAAYENPFLSPFTSSQFIGPYAADRQRHRTEFGWD
jgi:hypothetical protein